MFYCRYIASRVLLPCHRQSCSIAPGEFKRPKQIYIRLMYAEFKSLKQIYSRLMYGEFKSLKQIYSRLITVPLRNAKLKTNSIIAQRARHTHTHTGKTHTTTSVRVCNGSQIKQTLRTLGRRGMDTGWCVCVLAVLGSVVSVCVYGLPSSSEVCVAKV